MSHNLLKSWIIVAMLLVLGACGSPATQSPTAPQAAPTDAMPKPTDAMAKPTDAMAKPTDAMAKPTDVMAKPTDVMAKPTDVMAKPTDVMTKPTDVMAKPTDAAMTEHAMAAWQTIELTDARTGKTFHLGDFTGKTIYIEPMATWCPNCRAQLANVQQAKAQLASDDFVFVALSVESDLDKAKLAEYADSNGFEATFAVSSAEMLQALVDSFGRSITNPPSTPHFIVRPDGSTTELMTGKSDAAQIVEMMQMAMKGQ